MGCGLGGRRHWPSAAGEARVTVRAGRAAAGVAELGPLCAAAAGHDPERAVRGGGPRAGPRGQARRAGVVRRLVSERRLRGRAGRGGRRTRDHPSGTSDPSPDRAGWRPGPAGVSWARPS